MRHTLRFHDVIVGHSELEHADPALGRAWGAFRPGLGYELIQPVFRLYARAVPHEAASDADEKMLERYYKARDALALRLDDAAGNAIETSAIHIADYTIEAGSAAIELDVLIRDEGYWSRRTPEETA